MKVLAGMAMTEQQVHALRDLFNALEQASGFRRLVEDRAGASGEAVAVFDFAHFERWCSRVAIPPCVDALRAYSLVQRAPSSAARYGRVALN